MARKTAVKCPRCSKRLSRQGLNGHLRFVHGVGAEDVRATMRQGTVEDRASRVLELIQRLKEIREQRKAAEEDWWWAADKGERETREVVAKTCENLESEILAELQNLGLREAE